jgi:hypothetical protein
MVGELDVGAPERLAIQGGVVAAHQSVGHIGVAGHPRSGLGATHIDGRDHSAFDYVMGDWTKLLWHYKLQAEVTKMG